MPFRKKLFIPLILLSLCFIEAKPMPGRLNIGDPMPPIKGSTWVKGTPVHHFKKGQIYVIDFWATWCVPCKVSIPYLSNLADKYKNKVTFIGIDIWEDRTEHPASTQEIKAFVDSMGKKMDFPIAIDYHHFMLNHWFKAVGAQGIPMDFIVNRKGKLAWIGNPVDLDGVLKKILNHNWNIKEAAAKRTFKQQLLKLNEKVRTKLPSGGDWDSMNISKKADSILILMNRLQSKDSNFKYTSNFIFKKFRALLIRNPSKAYKYGQKVLKRLINQETACSAIIRNIRGINSLHFPGYIYYLGAEAYQIKMDRIPELYKQDDHVIDLYEKMTKWYRLAFKKTFHFDNNAIVAPGDDKGKTSKEKHGKVGLDAPPPPPPPPHK